MIWGKFAHLESMVDVREMIVNDYGHNSAVPFAYFLPEFEGKNETISLTPSQADLYINTVKAEVMELRATKAMLESIQSHTWIYSLGFRAGVDGEIVNPSIEYHLKRVPYPSPWIILSKRLGLFSDFESLEAMVIDILESQIISDFEQGINYLFKPEDVTGAGSDAIDPDGRNRLKKYFGFAKYCENLNQRLVDRFDIIRKLSPKK